MPVLSVFKEEESFTLPFLQRTVSPLMVTCGINTKPVFPAEPAAAVVTVSAPVEPLPTVAVMVVEERILNDAAAVPPKLTWVAVLKFVPVMVTIPPFATLVGVNEAIVTRGCGVIKLKPLKTALPPDAVTLTLPDDPAPTVARMVVLVRTAKSVTVVPPSVMESTPAKPVPVIVITSPCAAASGETAVIINWEGGV